MHRIKTKITVFIVLILVFVVAVELGSIFLFSKTYYISQKEKEMNQIYKELTVEHFDSMEDLVNTLELYEEKTGMQFLLANRAYQCTYNSKQFFNGMAVTSRFNSSYDFNQNSSRFLKEAKSKSTLNEKKEEIIELNGFIQTADEIFYIRILSTVTAIEANIKTTNDLMLRVSITALIIGGIFSFLFAHQFAKPIQEVDRIARNVAKFDFSMRATEDLSDDELGRLAHNINVMADNLESTIGELQESNRILEKDNFYMNKIDDMRKEFIANASHELKTPITVLAGYTEMLQNNIEGIDKDFYYQVIMEECERMSQLIHTMLDLSTMEKGLGGITLKPVDLSNLVSKLVKEKEILFRKKDIICETNIDSGCVVIANELYLGQAIINYVTNAIKYTPVGGKISVTVSYEKEYGKVSVFNEGDPIDVRIMSKIWDSFYRSALDRAVKENDHDKNVGLGLYIVRTIMNSHHGQYGVNNVKDGVEFYLMVKRK